MSGPWGLWTGDDVADEGESAEPGLPSAEPVDESSELGQPALRGQPEEDTVGVGRLERTRSLHSNHSCGGRWPTSRT